MTDKRTAAVERRVAAALEAAGIDPSTIGPEVQPVDERYTDADPSVAGSVIPTGEQTKPILAAAQSNRQLRRQEERRGKKGKQRGGQSQQPSGPIACGPTGATIECLGCHRKVDVVLHTRDAEFAYCISCNAWSTIWSDVVRAALRAYRLQVLGRMKAASS